MDITRGTNEPTIRRRRVLQVASGAIASGIAGCAGGDGGGGDGGDGTPTETPAGTPTRTPSPTPTPAPTPSLTIRNQKTDGKQVVVPRATIDQPGWLIVHPAADDGGPNPRVAVAAKRLEPGEHADVSLSLDEPIARSGTLFAMLHYDDPADGEFTFPKQGDPAVTVEGKPVIEPFSVTVMAKPTISVTDQTTDGRTVVVPGAAIDKPGWLVIHPSTRDGEPKPGIVLGAKQLPPGEYTRVEVALDKNLTQNGTVFAMLHYDDPADGEFTFPDEGDPAVTVDGTPVIEPFDVTVTGGGAGRRTVRMTNSSFKPRRLTVQRGTTVEWVNQDMTDHTVTSATFHGVATAWDFDVELSKGQTTSRTFREAGIYEYYCTIHGKDTMCGVVLVDVDRSFEKELPCEKNVGY